MQYKEDFERERKDREDAAGRHNDEIAGWQLASQKLQDERCNDQEAFQQTQRVLKEEINKLKGEKEQTEKSMKEEIAKLEKESRNLQEILQQTQTALDEQVTKLKQENIQQRNTFESARVESEHHIADLNKQHEAERGQHLKRIAELEYEAEVMTATKQSLEEKVEDIETKLHVKEKHLEIALNEKAAIEERLERVEAQRVGLHHDKVDLQKQLQGAIKDTANLSDELLAKNQQVKQFRKKVEEFRGHLNETRSELDTVKGHLQQTRAKMQEQATFYQEQLKQTGEDAESKVG